ncbi:MAG: hypothetical protein MI922_14035, partial [Bacteroidales bacterium]|nr:hypothetical protein [Bacteroidales bacterium]
MSETRTIPTPKPADLVTQTIMVDGTEIPSTINVLSITIDKEVNKIASAKLVLVDGNPAEEDFPISNENLFNPGNEIEILAGYHSDESTVFKGIIIKHGLKIRSQGGSMLKIECKDVAVKTTVGRKSKYFYESKDSDAIEEVLNASGAQLSVEATTVDHQEIVQYDTTDWDFAITRAEMNGMFCFNENGNIDIKKPDFSTDPVVTLTYGATMLELDAEIDSSLQLNGIKSKSWDYTNQEVLEIEANDQDTTSGGNLAASDLAGVVAPDEYLHQPRPVVHYRILYHRDEAGIHREQQHQPDRKLLNYHC